MIVRTIAATGHRPQKLGGFSDRINKQLKLLAIDHLNYRTTPIYSETIGISGMALGWDTAVALACVELDIPFIAAVPFKGQESRWGQRDQEIYRMLLEKAIRVEYVCEPGYAPCKMFKRNEWMVDHASEMAALWDGVKSGGTYGCIQYAEKQGKEIHNLWEAWEQRRA